MVKNFIAMLKKISPKGWLLILWVPFYLTLGYLLRGVEQSSFWMWFIPLLILLIVTLSARGVKDIVVEGDYITFAKLKGIYAVPMVILLESLVLGSVIAFIDPVSRVIWTSSPMMVTLEEAHVDTTVRRISCDSVTRVISRNKLVKHAVVTLKGDFTYDTAGHPDNVFLGSNTTTSYHPLVIDSLRCGDTLVISKRSIPYEDRGTSLTRTHKKYIEAGKWTVKEETIYRNQSPQIGDWELYHLFTKKQARWVHTLKDSKYTLSLTHESKVDTLDSREDAQGLLEAKCKDAASKKEGFSYAEFDACKSNGSISKIKVPREEFCGYAKVHLNWKRGSLSSQPYGCWGANPNWYYERDPLGIRGWR